MWICDLLIFLWSVTPAPLKSNIDIQNDAMFFQPFRYIFQGPSFLVSMSDFGGVLPMTKFLAELSTPILQKNLKMDAPDARFTYFALKGTN